MLPRRLSFLRPAILTMAALVLSFSSARNGLGQNPTPGTASTAYDAAARQMSSANPGNGSQTNTSSGMSSSSSSEINHLPIPNEVVCPGGCYGGFHPLNRRAFAGESYGGFFRRYWAYGFYGPNYNMGAVSNGCGSTVYVFAASHPGHGLSHHGTEALSAPSCDLGGIPPAGDMNLPTLPASEPGQEPSEKLPKQTPNRAHLQLLVPENAEVLVEGVKTRKTGTIRDFVSPPLTPGKKMTYAIAIRYTDAQGKPIETTHSIRVRANDRLRIDCTSSTTSEQVRSAALR